MVEEQVASRAGLSVIAKVFLRVAWKAALKAVGMGSGLVALKVEKSDVSKVAHLVSYLVAWLVVYWA